MAICQVASGFEGGSSKRNQIGIFGFGRLEQFRGWGAVSVQNRCSTLQAQGSDRARHTPLTARAAREGAPVMAGGTDEDWLLWHLASKLTFSQGK
jgi:hypothetical protein